MTSPIDRIQALGNIEKDIASVLQYGSQALTELSKDKPVNKQVEGHVQLFIKTLTNVETELAKQINYLTQVSTGQAHEGSSYNSQKILQMTWHRLEHIRSEVNELEKLKNNQRIFRQPQSQQQQPPQSQSQQQNQTQTNSQQQVQISSQQSQSQQQSYQHSQSPYPVQQQNHQQPPS
ncbi:UNVERIFIED_CONTAM: hypothetical protein RMT77_010489 [Armadillidium vulgare]|nr:Mediator of RNA polymerase II transcription subunit 11 [Armadillidium vulgare]RXG70070.1 Mediator of RNA polymerase II transcription subunit 11 [Armadillidium vulgare]